MRKIVNVVTLCVAVLPPKHTEKHRLLLGTGNWELGTD